VRKAADVKLPSPATFHWTERLPDESMSTIGCPIVWGLAAAPAADTVTPMTANIDMMRIAIFAYPSPLPLPLGTRAYPQRSVGLLLAPTVQRTNRPVARLALVAELARRLIRHTRAGHQAQSEDAKYKRHESCDS
jgi:hypothetical protein